MKYEPHDYQLKAKEHVLSNKFCALFLKMGLGKSSIMLSVIKNLLFDFEVGKVLILGPLRVVKSSWPGEIRKWDDFRDVTYSIIHGTPKQRESALKKDADIYLINYEGLKWLVEYYGDNWPFDMVVFDESSKMKAPGTQRFRALKKVLKHIKRSVLLTGSPASNGLMGLWSQMFILDRGERLGRTFTVFKNRWFYPVGYEQRQWEIKPTGQKEIQNRIQDICMSMKTEDYIKLPDYIPNVINVELRGKLRDKYDELEKEMYLALSEEEEITAVNAATLTNKCRQFTSGAMYKEDKDWVEIHDLKLDALDDIIEEANGAPVLVAYQYKYELARLKQRYPHAVALGSDPAIIDAWNRKEIPILLAHPQSAGHGLNLQEGGNILVHMTMDWSLENYEQFNARLHRQGQTEPVFCHHIVATDTVDEKVMERLRTKKSIQDILIESLKHKEAA